MGKQYIYKYVGIFTGKVKYIGKTNDLERRCNEHLKYDSWSKFSDVEYFETNDSNVDELEQYLIEIYKPEFNEKRYPNKKSLTFELNAFIQNVKWLTYITWEDICKLGIRN